MDRNCPVPGRNSRHRKSLSARRAWIEIPRTRRSVRAALVALRKESVDRNINVLDPATHKKTVALRKESVDRNIRKTVPTTGFGRSLSARRAWIEMPSGAPGRPRQRVALRKESVDRNGTKATQKRR